LEHVLGSCERYDPLRIDFDGGDKATLSRDGFSAGVKFEIFLEIDEPPFVETKNVVSA
jgi:hypothetical protein